jgi:hypothetical protein
MCGPFDQVPIMDLVNKNVGKQESRKPRPFVIEIAFVKASSIKILKPKRFWLHRCRTFDNRNLAHG